MYYAHCNIDIYIYVRNKCNIYNIQYEVEHMLKEKILHINVLLLYGLRNRK